MDAFELKIVKIAQINAYKLNELMLLANIHSYYIAGGCFQKNIRDYDIFPIEKNAFDHILQELKTHIVFSSKNAITVKYKDLIVQFCKYHKNNLKELVDSFDFSHCQIGAKVENETEIKEVYASENYRVWKLTDDDDYVGSQYPLSSLIRCCKYKDRFLFENYKKIIIKTLIDVINRGFKDYADFKDQLDAIDLAYLEESAELKDLFELLRKDNK